MRHFIYVTLKCLLNWQSICSWIFLCNVIKVWRRIINRSTKHINILSTFFPEVIPFVKWLNQIRLMDQNPCVLEYLSYIIATKWRTFFSQKLLFLAVVHQAVFSRVANNIRVTIITVRKVHMKIPEDYNARWLGNCLRYCDEVLVWQSCPRIQTV